MKFKLNLFALIGFICALAGQAQANLSAREALAENVSLPFGSEGEVVYNTQTGFATVFLNNAILISNAFAVVKSEGMTYNSQDYTSREVTVEEITDDFGVGKKMIVNLTGDNLPAMQQIFYTYDGKGYFLTEVLLMGESVSSNYMAPLVAETVDLGAEGDNRILFVPFDNDTFIKYESRSMEETLTNVSAEVTAFYENNSRRGLVVGSVEHAVWKTGVKTTGAGSTLTALTAWGGYTDPGVTRDVIPHGIISGDTVKSPRIFVGLFEDWRDGMEAFAKANAIAEPRYIFNWEASTPFGWNSWGAIQSDLNLNKAKAVVDFFSGSIPKFRNGETAYIDLDSYWDNMISGGLGGDFTALIDFVKYCKSKGLKAGIYWAPFVDWGKYDRPVEGSSYNYSDAWTKVNGAYHDLDGARAMDPTHPATQKRIDLVIDKFKACGFEMIKIDFIGHAAIESDGFYDPTVKTGMQAVRKGMEYLVDRLDDKMLVYAAISPNLATGPYVHSRRIACDAYADINATSYTLNSTTYGWWQTYIYNFIDADHLVFGNASLGENHARLTSGLVNGTLITGDDFSTTGQWTERAKVLLQNQDILNVGRDGVAFRPVEGNVEEGASEVFVRRIDDAYYIALINYGDKKKYNLDLDRLNIPVDTYQVKELFSATRFSLDGTQLTYELAGKDAAVFKLTTGLLNAISPDAPDGAILYPNPTEKILKIRYGTGIRALKITDVKGKAVLDVKDKDSMDYEIDMADYPENTYIITIEGNDGKTRSYKVIKQ